MNPKIGIPSLQDDDDGIYFASVSSPGTTYTLTIQDPLGDSIVHEQKFVPAHLKRIGPTGSNLAGIMWTSVKRVSGRVFEPAEYIICVKADAPDTEPGEYIRITRILKNGDAAKLNSLTLPHIPIKPTETVFEAFRRNWKRRFKAGYGWCQDHAGLTALVVMLVMVAIIGICFHQSISDTWSNLVNERRMVQILNNIKHSNDIAKVTTTNALPSATATNSPATTNDATVTVSAKATVSVANTNDPIIMARMQANDAEIARIKNEIAARIEEQRILSGALTKAAAAKESLRLEAATNQQTLLSASATATASSSPSVSGSNVNARASSTTSGQGSQASSLAASIQTPPVPSQTITVKGDIKASGNARIQNIGTLIINNSQNNRADPEMRDLLKGLQSSNTTRIVQIPRDIPLGTNTIIIRKDELVEMRYNPHEYSVSLHDDDHPKCYSWYGDSSPKYLSRPGVSVHVLPPQIQGFWGRVFAPRTYCDTQVRINVNHCRR